jgi:hypothetical protein
MNTLSLPSVRSHVTAPAVVGEYVSRERIGFDEIEGLDGELEVRGEVVEGGRRLRIRRQPDSGERERAQGRHQRRNPTAQDDPETRQRESQHERLAHPEERHEAAAAQRHGEHHGAERDGYMDVRRAAPLGIDHHEQRRGDEGADPVRVDPRPQPAGFEGRQPFPHAVDG